MSFRKKQPNEQPIEQKQMLSNKYLNNSNSSSTWSQKLRAKKTQLYVDGIG